jgi:uncharacterized coiled-coil protein SlyX
MAVEKQQEEFELIPMSPLRRLEKRIDQLESSPGVDTRDFFREIVDIVRMNQQIVDELAKANDALRIEISKLPSKIEDLVNSMKEMLSYIKASAVEETGVSSPNFKPLVDKLDQLVEGNKKVVESNQAVLSELDSISRRLVKPALPPMRKPMLPMQRPIQ